MNTAKTKGDVLDDINEKLGGVLGFLAVRDLKGDVNKMVPRLKEIGLSTKMMALVTGISENAVAIRISRLKKPSAKKAASTPKAKAKTGKKATPASDEGSPSAGTTQATSAATE